MVPFPLSDWFDRLKGSDLAAFTHSLQYEICLMSVHMNRSAEVSKPSAGVWAEFQATLLFGVNWYHVYFLCAAGDILSPDLDLVK